MNTDSGDRHSNPLWRAQEIPPRDDPVTLGPQHQDLDQMLVPGCRGLISGLLGLNTVLLGAALITGQLFNLDGLQSQEARIFLLLLMGASVVWMLWYLLWARKQPDMSPHQDHHAGGLAATSKSVRTERWCLCSGLMCFFSRSSRPFTLCCTRPPPVCLHDRVSDDEEGL